MISNSVKDMIPKIQQYFAGQPITKAWLFGSCSRGEETKDSDIDSLVTYDDSEAISLLTISRITITLTKILNKKVDIVEDDCLLPFARKYVDNDKILIYEREN